MERETGIEPATNSLEGCDSTTELLPPSRHHLRPAATARQAPSSRLARFPARRSVGRTRCAALVVNRLPPGPAASYQASPANRRRAKRVDQKTQEGSPSPPTFSTRRQLSNALENTAVQREAPVTSKSPTRKARRQENTGGEPLPTNFLHPAPTLLRAGGRKLVGRGGFEPP